MSTLALNKGINHPPPMKSFVSSATKALFLFHTGAVPPLCPCPDSLIYRTVGYRQLLVSDLVCATGCLGKQDDLGEGIQVLGPLLEGFGYLVAVQPTLLDELHSDATKVADSLHSFVQAINQTRSHFPSHHRQEPLHDVAPIFQWFSTGPGQGIVAVKESTGLDAFRILEEYLPQFHQLVPLSLEPTSVTETDLARIRAITAAVTYDERVAEVVGKVAISQLQQDVQHLTGESGDLYGTPSGSRYSSSRGAQITAEWLKNQVEDTGARCELSTFRVGFSPNVICRYNSTGTEENRIIVGAHYDSISETRQAVGPAPGANDDASGTSSLLSMARVIKLEEIRFKSLVEIVFFSGEEQGLWGSANYSRQLANDRVNITFMTQSDMLAYRKPGEPLQLSQSEVEYGTRELAQLISKVSSLYCPELRVGVSHACCSDHLSFFQRGFVSNMLFGRVGLIADPEYHSSRDLSEREGFDFEQLKSITKAHLATILHAAGFERRSSK